VTRPRGSSVLYVGEKKVCATCGTAHWGWYDRRRQRARDLSCGKHRIYLDLEVRRIHCRRCGTVKGERLESFLQNALHTERFARYVGQRCRSGTIKDAAEELNLDWRTRSSDSRSNTCTGS
jgi:transposase